MVGLAARGARGSAFLGQWEDEQLHVECGWRIGRRGPAAAPRSLVKCAGGGASEATRPTPFPMAMATPSVTLGIDLGTTSVKAAVVEAAPDHPSGFVVLASCVRATRAEAAAQSAATAPQVRQRPGAAPPPGAS